MFVINVVVLIVLYSTSCANGQDAIEYTDNNFSLKMLEHETALVMFYTPWCAHCKKLKPEFNKASKELAENDPPVKLVKVDCSQSGKKTCSYLKVNGYPTLKVFRRGVAEGYSGPRDASGIVKYMTLHGGPCSREITDLSVLENFLSSGPVAIVIGFFDEESDFRKPFLDVAGKMRGKAQFGHTSLQDVSEKYEVNNDEIILFRPAYLRNKLEDDSIKFFGNVSSVDEIKDFILNNSHGLVGHRTNTNREDFKVPNVIAYYHIDYERNLKRTNYWRNRIIKIAQRYKDKLTFAVSNVDELKEIGQIQFKDKPIVFATDSNNEKYQMEGEFSTETLEEFVGKFLENKLEVYKKSEDIPENNDNPVKIAVGKNFKDVIMENGKDTFIVFHTPWCSHCKKLMPTYELLAEKLKDEEIVLAKMDASTNYIPAEFKVTSYPTIYWLPKHSKGSPVKYEGGRKMEDLIKYIAKQATEELKSYDRNGKSKRKDEL